MILPEKIRDQLAGQEYSSDRVGMSNSTVLLFPNKVLKIQRISEETDREYRMMQWLQGKLPVPRILDYVQDGEDSFLLMSRCPGEMSCSREALEDPDTLARMLAEALELLWTVDVRECPFDSRLQAKLEAARYNVEHGLVDLDNVDPETFGEGGFRSPEHLLERLWADRPAEGEPVLSHGDFCLPNVFFDQGRVSGYIDLGRSGIADKWQDIALCYRSLCHNFDGRYAPEGLAEGARADFDADRLFDYLGIEPDREKLRYYILLDELF